MILNIIILTTHEKLFGHRNQGIKIISIRLQLQITDKAIINRSIFIYLSYQLYILFE